MNHQRAKLLFESNRPTEPLPTKTSKIVKASSEKSEERFVFFQLKS